MIEMIQVSRIEFHENFPTHGEAYAIVTDGKRFAFVWGPEYPYADNVPTENVYSGESGIEWFNDEVAARNAMEQATEAVGAGK